MAELSRADRLASLKARRESLNATSTIPQTATTETLLRASDSEVYRETTPAAGYKEVDKKDQRKAQVDAKLGSFDGEYLGSFPVPKATGESVLHAAIDRAQESTVPEKKVAVALTLETISLLDVKSKAVIIGIPMKNITSVILDSRDKKIVAFIERDPVRNAMQCLVLRVKAKAKETVQLIEKAMAILKTDVANTPTAVAPMSPVYGDMVPSDAGAAMQAVYGNIPGQDGDLNTPTAQEQAHEAVYGNQGVYDSLPNKGTGAMVEAEAEDAYGSLDEHQARGPAPSSTLFYGHQDQARVPVATTAAPLYGDNANDIYGDHSTAQEAAAADIYGDQSAAMAAVQASNPQQLYGDGNDDVTEDATAAGQPSHELYGNQSDSAGKPPSNEIYGDNGGEGPVEGEQLYGNVPNERVKQEPTSDMYRKFLDDPSAAGDAVYATMTHGAETIHNTPETAALSNYGDINPEDDGNLVADPASPDNTSIPDEADEGAVWTQDAIEVEQPVVVTAKQTESPYSAVQRVPLSPQDDTAPKKPVHVQKAKVQHIQKALSGNETPKKPILLPKKNSSQFVSTQTRELQKKKSASELNKVNATENKEALPPLEKPWNKEQETVASDLARHEAALAARLEKEKEMALRAEEAKQRMAQQALAKKMEEEKLRQQIEAARRQEETDRQDRSKKIDELTDQNGAASAACIELYENVRELFRQVGRERAVASKTATKDDMRAGETRLQQIEVEILGGARQELPMPEEEFGFGMESVEQLIEKLAATQATIAQLRLQQIVAERQIQMLKEVAQTSQMKRQQDKLRAEEHLAKVQAAREKDLQLLKEKQEKIDAKLHQAAQDDAARRAAEAAERDAREQEAKEVTVKAREQRTIAEAMKLALQEEEAARLKREADKGKWRQQHEEIQNARKRASILPPTVTHAELNEPDRMLLGRPALHGELRHNPLAEDIPVHPMIALSAQGKHSKDSLKRMWRTSFGLNQM